MAKALPRRVPLRAWRSDFPPARMGNQRWSPASSLGLAMSFAAKLGPVDNSQIADRLESFASLLELADANPYTVRAYRRAAETVRGVGASVAELVASGRARELRGIGPGIEERLRELVQTGAIAELEE